MSMRPTDLLDIPSETIEVARAAFPDGNLYMQLRDELGIIYHDHDFADLFPKKGQPALSPWQLVLVCIMQFLENLSDRQAADAVRARIDWKYALSLPLRDSGFNYSVLSEFRKRLIAGDKEQQLFDSFLEHLQAKGFLKEHHQQRTDATHILASIRTLNRLELFGETFRAALNSLVVADPQWLSEHMHDDWFDRYGRRIENYRLPKPDSERKALGSTIGQDGLTLLDAIYAPSSPPWLKHLPAVETLRQVWLQRFYPPNADGTVEWRKVKDMPPSDSSIHSPYDVEARYSNKRSMDWVGYKVHLTEVCDPESPRLITHVHTTSATVPDDQVVEPIHLALAKKQLLPKEHLLDGGYLSAEHLVNSKAEYDMDVIGPVRQNHSWQAKAGNGFDSSFFLISWDQQKVVCPQGHFSTKWLPGKDIHGKDVIQARFQGTTCRSCPVRSQCTKSKTQPRELTFRPRELHQALNERRQVQRTTEFKEKYSLRAGVESTHSQGIRRFGMRQSRYIGLAKSHLQNVFCAIALNFVRLDAWFNDVPLAKTRVSLFKRILQPLPA
ncbi:IS5-like element ISAcma45 family transposase [Acaryochloris marina]|uniref:Transposase, putative n=1 Tax=Acaryochloris marina (strain MBIC 11017) TaxID=329726 RepID=A8ZMN7_ACAM1|nr:IS5-like element ISAcma45 family transposase [Acaryochloris marina]ABW32448.1 transposase, putative [Acaryochloris marina MBIC11017]ABW32993.1 transposase, putative [Acaryochloris marina MBIC11017]ABW32996.1 transposase, putative [Acaryochloris marina MBIC11017]ABW33121.1 transposase, putative [Acaryochloris marina MBIC11017]ABW33176.1 transposase, putative [Acaryochloris marina MBIC11017]